ncbi:MAG: RidA family protein [Reyranella sp.]
MMPQTTISYLNPENTCPAQGLYSHVTDVPAGRTLYIAGQLSVGLDGSVVGKNDFAAQMKQVLDNLGAVLKGTGLGFNNVIKFTTYLVHSQDIESFMKIRAETFPKLFGGTQFPPNTLLIVDRLVKEEFLIEIEAIAFADPSGAMRQG